MTQIQQSLIDINAPSLVDLRNYDQSWFERGRPDWYVLLWWLVQAIVFPITPQPMNSIRCLVLRWFGAKIGKGVLIRPTARFTYPWKVEIGDYSWIGDNVVFYSLDRISIGDHCVISQKSYLCTGSHDFSDRAFRLETNEITIGHGVWIATDCFIAPGVQIGSNAVIGTRSTVLKSMPTQTVCWGSPCRSQYMREMQ